MSSPFDQNSWDGQRVWVVKTLEDIADCQEKQTQQISDMRSDLRLLDFKMMLIGFVTGLVTSGIVSGLMMLIFRKS